MQSTSATYAPYTDTRRIELSFTFGVVAPEAAASAKATSSAQSSVSQIVQMTDDVEEMSGKYTSLETNMWILDGTMEVYPGDQVGWQSSVISDDEKTFSSNPWVDFQFDANQDSYGFTLIFDDTQPDNYPKQVITTTYDLAGSQIGTVTTSPDDYIHIVNLPTQDYRRVHFEFVGTNIPHRRVRICGVRFGIEYTYDKTSISNLIVRQSVNPWAESLSSAEIDATVDNSGQLYNMINPDGLYAYLQDGQFMEWAIAVDGEAVFMGRQYFTSAESEDGGLTASITFNDRLLVMDDMEYTGGSDGTWTLSEAVSDILAASGTGISAAFDGSLGNTTIKKNVPQGTSIRESLRLCAQAAMCTCYFDRNNQLHFFTPAVANSPDDTWTRDVQHEDTQVKVGQLYNVVRLTVGNEYVEGAEEAIYTASNIATDDFERVYEVSNPVVNDGNAVAQWILGWIQRRVSYEVTARGNPALDLLDTVRIDDIYGVNGSAILTQLDYTYDGGLECDAAAIR